MMDILSGVVPHVVDVRQTEAGPIVRRSNRLVGRFHYELVLPSDVSADQVEAKLEDGVLKIRIRKVQRAEARRIEVK